MASALVQQQFTSLPPGEIIEFKETSINAHDKFGFTKLHIAVETDSWGQVEELLAQGADPSITNSNGFTALHIAVAQRSAAWIDLLRKYTTDFNVKAEFGTTPLHLAIIHRRGHPMIWKLLLFGADPSIENDDGETPIDLAIELKQHMEKRMMLKHLKTV